MLLLSFNQCCKARLICLFSVLLCFALYARAQTAPIEASILQAPEPVRGSDGRTHLGYEIQVTNFYRDTGPLRLIRLSVFAKDSETPLLSLSGSDLEAALHHPGAESLHEGALIAGGLRAVAFVWITLDPNRKRPEALRHELVFRKEDGTVETLKGLPVEVMSEDPVVLRPPLLGGSWLMLEGPGSSRSHHWGSLVSVNGRTTIPQRYAIDFVGLDSQGHAVRANAPDLHETADQDWIGFDSAVVAVGDGVVVDAQDGSKDGKPLAPQDQPDRLTARTLYGNFVILEITPHTFVHYAHLRQGSVAVKIGDKVRAGALLGRLGQSGNAGGPHLHFHISDRPTFEESEGKPFVFRSFTLLGSSNIDRSLSPKSRLADTPTSHRGELPLDNDVIKF